MSRRKNSRKNMLNFPRKLIYLSLSLVAASLGTLAVTKPALADPPPTPPPNTILPPVFCFRFTDIKADPNDAQGDKFLFSFEVLNWSNKPAGGVRMALNTGTNTLTIDQSPSFGGAAIDGNGRPIGSDADPLLGNQLFANTGSVVQSTSTAVQWTATQLDLNTFDSQPIPNRNLLGVPPVGGTALACGLVPGCVLQGGKPVVPNGETIDDGNNVLDGFVVAIDDLDEGEGISFNWQLLDESGNPIGSVGRGNAYGFGTVNIFRRPINEMGQADAQFRLLPGNSGASSSGTMFADGVNNVEDANGNPTDYFTGEFGAGIAAPFVKPEDNIFNEQPNVEPLPENEARPSDNVTTPEPGTLFGLGLVSLALLGSKRRR